MEEQFVTLLESQTPIIDVVGNRIYPVKLPQASPMPAMTYHVISAPRSYNQDGQTDLTPFLMQLDCWGETYGDAQSVRNAIVTAISGLIDQQIGSPAILFSAIFIQQERDGYASNLDDSDSQLYRKSMDLQVWAQEIS